MTLIVNILNRDFSTLPIKPYEFKVDKLTWSCFGGSHQGFITAHSTADRIVDFSSLLRCPVTISDHELDPVWSGYVDQIQIAFDNIIFTLSIEELFNRVQVRYRYLSPDNKLADVYDTPLAENLASQDFYGIKETILYRSNIDDDFALSLRDTFLNLSAFPAFSFSLNKPVDSKLNLQQAKITLRLAGWFNTLGWTHYQDIDGFYANHGPGPGVLPFGDGNTSVVAQAFYVSKTVHIKYAYALLRKINSPTSNVVARIYNTSGSAPGSVIGSSSGVPGSSLAVNAYAWVKFTFASPVTLAGGALYWLGIDPNIYHSTNHYMIRVDDNSNFIQEGNFGRHFHTGAWRIIPSTISPAARPHLYFRVVGIADTGTILKDIGTFGNQFFTNVLSFSTGVFSTPYRDNSKSCLEEALALMKMGTSNHRFVLANVTSPRDLIFYEQPPRDHVTGFIDRYGRFFTHDMKLLPPYKPPIGQNVMLSSHDRSILPFDFERSPVYFVDRFSYSQ